MLEIQQKSVTLKDVSSETFDLIIKSIYTGDDIVTKDNLIELWRTAHQLQIHFLISECESFVLKNMSMENYAQYFYISNILSSDVVLETLRPFVLKNCTSFFQTSYFLQLSMADALSLVKSQDLETKSEDDVIHAILKWAEFQYSQPQFSIRTISSSSGNNAQMESCDDRNNPGDVSNKDGICKNLTILLSHARTCLASNKCLKMLGNHPLVRENNEVKDILIEALTYQLENYETNGQWLSRAVHRNNSGFVYCLVSACKSGKDAEFNAYSLARKKWLKFPRLVGVDKVELATAAYQLYALCTGQVKYFVNRSSSSPSKKLFLFKLDDGGWTDITISLTLVSGDFSVAAVNYVLYIFSVHDEKVWELRTIFRQAAQVTHVSNLPTNDAIAYLTTCDQWILVFYDSTVQDVDETVVQSYDTSLNTWTKLNNLPGPANGMTSFKGDHFTYLLQSNGNLWKVVQLQPDLIGVVLVGELWSRNCPLHGAVTFLDELYIHGPESDELSNDLRRSLPGVFSKINYIENNGTEISRSLQYKHFDENI